MEMEMEIADHRSRTVGVFPDKMVVIVCLSFLTFCLSLNLEHYCGIPIRKTTRVRSQTPRTHSGIWKSIQENSHSSGSINP